MNQIQLVPHPDGSINSTWRKSSPKSHNNQWFSFLSCQNDLKLLPNNSKVWSQSSNHTLRWHSYIQTGHSWSQNKGHDSWDIQEKSYIHLILWTNGTFSTLNTGIIPQHVSILIRRKTRETSGLLQQHTKCTNASVLLKHNLSMLLTKIKPENVLVL